MAPSSKPPPLSAAQLEAMNVVWERGPVTITEVWQDRARRRKIARATVQTVINRLEEKGWLGHRVVGQAFLYSAARSRESVQGRPVKELVDAAFGGSADGMAWALLNDRGVSAEEARRIQAMIHQAAKKGHKGRRKR